jgi:uncharacterized protein (DUF2249 family)
MTSNFAVPAATIDLRSVAPRERHALIFAAAMRCNPVRRWNW